jgi:fused signal recognition particle receptor
LKFGERIKSFFSVNTVVTEQLLEDLCDLLIEGDFGAAEAYRLTELLKTWCKNESPENLPKKLAQLLEDELNKVNINNIYPVENKFTSILLLGVNGVGKTTTAAKLSFFYNTQFGKKTILAAADTFRAAAIEQLKIHGKKLDTRVIAHKPGGDPAAVVYDALEAAQSGNIDVLIADTAGRMHTKTALIEELRKIDRVVESKMGGACYLKYLVLDATTGKNAYSQAEIFHDAVTLDGVILTKYDSTAKGGVVFSLASGLHLPVAYICTGEKYGDIEIFNSQKFTREFTGIE